MREKMTKCRSFEELADFFERSHWEDNSASMDEHISSCRSCGELAAWFRKIVAEIRANKLFDAPDYVINRAVALFKNPKQNLSGMIRAVLRFDSWADPAMAGVRTSDRGARQLIYRAGEYQIYLMLLPGEKASAVLGQLVPCRSESGTAKCEIALRCDNRTIVKRKLNSSGEFYLGPASRRTLEKKLDLVIYDGSESILVADITANSV
jgi:hypothetical protein